jgi:hypothetical protein
VGRELPLDASQEPRLKKLDDATDVTKASHPFFWAGYMLLDTGTRPEGDVEPSSNAGGAANTTKAAGAKDPPAPEKPANAADSPPLVPPRSSPSATKPGSG